MTPTKEAIDAAETKAARRAMEVFVEVLCEELEKLGAESVVQALGFTRHEHTAFYTDGAAQQGAIKFSFVFDDSPMAVAGVLACLKEQGG